MEVLAVVVSPEFRSLHGNHHEYSGNGDQSHPRDPNLARGTIESSGFTRRFSTLRQFIVFGCLLPVYIIALTGIGVYRAAMLPVTQRQTY